MRDPVATQLSRRRRWSRGRREGNLRGDRADAVLSTVRRRARASGRARRRVHQRRPSPPTAPPRPPFAANAKRCSAPAERPKPRSRSSSSERSVDPLSKTRPSPARVWQEGIERPAQSRPFQSGRRRREQKVYDASAGRRAARQKIARRPLVPTALDDPLIPRRKCATSKRSGCGRRPAGRWPRRSRGGRGERGDRRLVEEVPSPSMRLARAALAQRDHRRPAACASTAAKSRTLRRRHDERAGAGDQVGDLLVGAAGR